MQRDTALKPNPLVGFEQVLFAAALAMCGALLFADIHSRFASQPWDLELALFRSIGGVAVAVPSLVVGLVSLFPVAVLAGLLFSRHPVRYGLLAVLPPALFPLLSGASQTIGSIASMLVLVLLGMVGLQIGANVLHRWRVPAIQIESTTPTRRLVTRAALDIAILLFFIGNVAVWRNYLFGYGRGSQTPVELLAFLSACLTGSCFGRYLVRART